MKFDFMLSAEKCGGPSRENLHGLAALSVLLDHYEPEEQRVGELPGIHGKHGAKYLLDAHGEVVGNGHRRPPHYLDNQSW
jgi:hypothetical protein